MAISFNNVPTTIRTPGTYVEIDNSRALQGLVQNPHKVLILGQKLAAGTSDFDTLQAITRDNLADGYFGTGSVLARMCNVFKKNNPNTEVHAMALGSGIAGIAASGAIDFSAAMYSDVISGTGVYYLMINGVEIKETITSGMSGMAIASMYASAINALSVSLPVTAAPSTAAASGGHMAISAVNSGTLGNYINIRANYYEGQSIPAAFSTAPTISTMADGAVDPDLGDAWAVIDNEQFHYIIQPYIDSANLTELETELADRFLPLEDLQGHGFTCVRATHASCTTLGNTRNSPHNTIVGINDCPNGPEEVAAAWGAVAAWNLNIDPARPLHFLALKDILPPPIESRFTRAERDILLYDGIATYLVDTGGNVTIERSITTYQSTALGTADPSYLDVQTLATLGEIRYQYKTRMVQRFIQPRFKLADDTFPVQPGQKIATPKTVRAETISLFTLLRDIGLIENLEDFIDNLVVERNEFDRTRCDVLLPPDLVNQFRILAGNVQFIL
jgi:phage tail sheath gpL-like